MCAPSSEPSPCRLRNSRRPEGRVSTRRARTACRTGYRTTGPAPPGGVSAQLSQTTRPTVPHPTPPAITHHHHHHTRPPATTHPRPIIRAARGHHNHQAVQPQPPPPPSCHRPDHTRHQPATHVREPTITPDHTAQATHPHPAPNPKHPHRHHPHRAYTSHAPSDNTSCPPSTTSTRATAPNRAHQAPSAPTPTTTATHNGTNRTQAAT